MGSLHPLVMKQLRELPKDLLSHFLLFFVHLGTGPGDCQSQRRLALSQVFSGPLVPPPLASSARTSSFCDSVLQHLEDFLPVEENRFSVLSLLMEVLQGLFPSVGGAMQALTHFTPRRLQENLFGGKFLQNAASLNFSGAVGSQGDLVPEQFSPQDSTISRNQVLMHFVSRALEEPAFLSGLQNFLQGHSDSQNLQQVTGKHKYPGVILRTQTQSATCVDGVVRGQRCFSFCRLCVFSRCSTLCLPPALETMVALRCLCPAAPLVAPSSQSSVGGVNAGAWTLRVGSC